MRRLQLNFSERVSKSLKEFIKNIEIDKNTIEYLNNVGINVYDENGKVKSVSEIFEELSEKITKKVDLNDFS